MFVHAYLAILLYTLIMKNRETQVKALSGQTRIRILQLLLDPVEHFSHQVSANPESFGVCMNLISEALEMSQPTISRHVGLLRQAGFVNVQKYKQWSYCKRDEKTLSEFYRWLKKELAIK